MQKYMLLEKRILNHNSCWIQCASDHDMVFGYMKYVRKVTIAKIKQKNLNLSNADTISAEMQVKAELGKLTHQIGI